MCYSSAVQFTSEMDPLPIGPIKKCRQWCVETFDLDSNDENPNSTFVDLANFVKMAQNGGIGSTENDGHPPTG